jgi:hypothetical protein
VVKQENPDLPLTGVSPSSTSIFAMTEEVRIKIAAIVTALFLGAVCTAGVLTHTHPPTVSAATLIQAATPAHPARAARPSPMNEHENYD